MTPLEDRFASLDEAFIAGATERRVPGAAWGLVVDGRLAHAGGTGMTRVDGGRTPDADTVFRIASMTKSFTAAALCLLRDEGRLRLDDEVARWVPDLAGWALPTTDAAPLTIRDLLTMSSGLATDDPWGDRQQSLPLDAFARLLRDGPTFAWNPGTAFEYSNLGYGILGRVVTAAGGAEYRDVVRSRLMLPLGMTGSGYGEEDVDVDRLALGYVRRGDMLVGEDPGPYGALASMGGIYTTVRDLATWVAGFLDAFPARSGPEGAHPLRRSTRREMQQVHRLVDAWIDGHPAHTAPMVQAGGYGYGLFITSDVALGTVVGHGGGYPGFGSYMTWHPASGIGVIVLANIRYGAGIQGVASRQLRALVLGEPSIRRRPRPWPWLDGDVALVERLLERWDEDADAAASARFAMNVDLDEPRDRRRAAVAEAVASVGLPLRRDENRPVSADSPAHRRWWLRGERGWVACALRLSPEPEPRIQTLEVRAVLDPSPALVAARDRLLGAADGGAWPEGLATADGVDRDVVMRGLRALLARLGSLDAGLVVEGTATSATWELGQVPGEATLAIALDEAGVATEVSVLVPGRDAPAEDR